MNEEIELQDAQEQALNIPVVMPSYCFCCGGELFKSMANTMACKKCGEMYDYKITETKELSVKLISNWA